MINATPTLPTASAQPPKDPTLAAKPAPQMAPKKKSNWKVILGSLVLLLVIAGGAVGFYLTQQAGIGDTRQQAAGEPGESSLCADTEATCFEGNSVCGSGQTKTGNCVSNGAQGVCCKAAPTGCSRAGGSCINGSSCGAGFFIYNQTVAGICSSGQVCCKPVVDSCSGTCVSANSCSQVGLQSIAGGTCGGGGRVCCGAAVQNISCYDLNQSCTMITTPANDPNGCSGGAGAGKYTSDQLCRNAMPITCCINGVEAPNQMTRSECGLSGGYERIAGSCGNLKKCYSSLSCASVEVSKTVACPITHPVDNPVNLPTSCTANDFCCIQNISVQRLRYACLNEGGTVGVCRSQTCSSLTTPSFCAERTDCQWSGTACANKVTASPGTGGTGIMCPNNNTLPAKKWVKFTCPNGCTQTTENGVTAWRCYDKRQDSTTELNLAPGECGQVDVLSGTTDDTYCGYKPSNYTCDQSQCQRQPSPSPTTPPQSSCASLEVLDPVSLAPVAKSSVVAGQEYRYRCVPGAGVPADYYFFTARSNTTGPLNLIYQGTSDLTFPIMTTDYLHVQCNPCVGTTCASAQNVNSSCNFEYTKTVTPGPQCLALWMASVDNPTVSLTNPKVGDRIFLGCGQVQGAARYIFKVTEPDGNVTNLGPLDVTAAPTTSEAYSITKQGRHYAQCQICTGQAESTCFPYETLPTQGQN